MFAERKEASGGFSFVEFLLVVATAAILLSSVDSWLGNYEVRSRVTDALNIGEAARKDIVITCTADSAIAELNNELVAHEFGYSYYVKSVTISGSCTKPLIIVETHNTGLIVEPTLVITGGMYGDIYHWSCQSDGLDIDTPARCRKG